MRHVMVPEVGQLEAKLKELQAGCRDGGLPTAQTPARLNAQRHFRGWNPRRLALRETVHRSCMAARGSVPLL